MADGFDEQNLIISITISRSFSQSGVFCKQEPVR